MDDVKQVEEKLGMKGKTVMENETKIQLKLAAWQKNNWFMHEDIFY